MITSNIAKRYARAFFDYARHENRERECFQELAEVSSMIQENRNLKDFLENPIFNKKDKMAVIERLLGKTSTSPGTKNFFSLLINKGRIQYISKIEAHYCKLIDASEGIVRGHVHTAYPLPSALQARLTEKIEALTGKKAELDIRVDHTLLGGVVVQVGDTVYDGSLKTQLNSMVKLLGEEI